MGNSNTVLCCSPENPTTVRIYHKTGKATEFQFPVLASRLMKEYPKHLVVYRSGNGRLGAVKPDGSPNSNSVCHITEIRIMRANCRLEVGQDYFLVPIPEQYMDHFSKYIKVSHRQVAPAPDDATLQSLTQASALEVSEASTAAPLGKAGKGAARRESKHLRNPSSYQGLQKRKDFMMHSKAGTRVAMISKTGSKSSRLRHGSRGHTRPKRSPSGGLLISPSSQKGYVSDQNTQKLSGLSRYHQYFRSKYGRRDWKPSLATISESDE